MGRKLINSHSKLYIPAGLLEDELTDWMLDPLATSDNDPTKWAVRKNNSFSDTYPDLLISDNTKRKRAKKSMFIPKDMGFMVFRNDYGYSGNSIGLKDLTFPSPLFLRDIKMTREKVRFINNFKIKMDKILRGSVLMNISYVWNEKHHYRTNAIVGFVYSHKNDELLLQSQAVYLASGLSQ